MTAVENRSGSGRTPAEHARLAWDGRRPPLILSLSGGGFRGYFTALVLARLEEMLESPCYRIFNLIAGTSIGGIIAILPSHWHSVFRPGKLLRPLPHPARPSSRRHGW